MNEGVRNRISYFKTLRSEILNCGCGVVAMFDIWNFFLDKWTATAVAIWSKRPQKP